MAEDQFLHIFLDESRENLQSIERGLLELEKSPHDLEIINEIFRAMHTIKGGAGLMGFGSIGLLAHHMESILEGLRSSAAKVDEQFFNLLFSGTDLLKQIFSSGDLEGETVKENVEVLIPALELYNLEMAGGFSDKSKEKIIFDDNFAEYNWEMIEEALLEGEKICQIDIFLHPGCVLKSVRVFMVIKAVEKYGTIIKAIPPVEILEEEKFDLDFTLLFLGDPDPVELKNVLERISEIENVNVIPDEKCDLKKLLIKESLYFEDKGVEGDGPGKHGTREKYYRISLKFPRNVLEQGIDPLLFIFELKESGTILENYINVAELPELAELDPSLLYVFWTIFYESHQTEEELETLFLFAGDDRMISLEDISASLSLWFSDEKRLGELLVDRGLVTEEDVDRALKKQKRIGELLVEQGKITTGQVEKIIQTKGRFRGKEQIETIRVDTYKLESIMNNIAELLIAQSHVKEMVFQHFGAERFLNMDVYNSFEEVDKIIRRLQEEVMNASMVPVGDTFIGFQRMVRDLAKDLGKEVELVISGKETELDKKVIEQISDPLKHLVRNAVDHGLEKPEERVASGKKRSGTIHLNAFHQEGNIVIEISDDGRGLDEEGILNRAREKNLLAQEDSLSKAEIHRLLFRPGFTTTSEISDLSGRGVGLDVVLNNIENLHGKIEVFSGKGRGTKFSIRLPLTLAIIDGIMVRVGGERFVIPLTSITEFIKAKPGEIIQAEGKGQMLHLRKEYIPFSSLYLLFDIKPEFKNPLDGILIILNEGNKKLALLVDEIIDQEQVVIKSVKDFMQDNEGMAGATILGDGSVAFILEVSSLFRMSRNSFKTKLRA